MSMAILGRFEVTAFTPFTSPGSIWGSVCPCEEPQFASFRVVDSFWAKEAIEICRNYIKEFEKLDRD